MQLVKRFTSDQLIRIVDEASLFFCACPAQVSREILSLRDLWDFQENCLADAQVNRQTHLAIQEATIAAHAALEDCLDRILRLEAWDLDTLSLPPAMRRLREDSLTGYCFDHD